MLIFIDANVLFSKILLTLLLDMATNEVFTFLWSKKILEETSKNLKLKQKNSNHSSVDKLISDIEFSFDLSLIHDYEYASIEKSFVRTDSKVSMSSLPLRPVEQNILLRLIYRILIIERHNHMMLLSSILIFSYVLYFN